MNNKKIIEDKRTRTEIIQDNFFKYLEKRKITSAKYAKVHNLSPSIVSRWKNYEGKMSAEHIFEATKYFGISTNDLYYTDLEKKQISAFSDPSYDPIIAQQHVDVKMLTDSFSRPSDIVSTTIALSVVMVIISFFIVKYSAFWSLLLLFIPFGAKSYFNSEFGIRKTFSINYLDDVYYNLKNSKDEYFIIKVLLHVASLILAIISFGILNTKIDVLPENNIYDMYMLTIIIIFVHIIVNFVTLFIRQREYKESIYDNEIRNYHANLINFYVALLMFCYVVVLQSLTFSRNWGLLIITFIIVGFSYFEFYLTSKKYSEYKLVYEEYGKEIRELFPKN